MTTPVDTLITDARTYANGTLVDAKQAIGDALNVLATLGGKNVAGGLSAAAIAPGVGVPVPNESPIPDDPGAVPAYSGMYYTEPLYDAIVNEFREVSVPAYVAPLDPGAPPDLYEPVPQDKPTGDAANEWLLQNPPNPDPNDFTIDEVPDLIGEIKAIDPPEILKLEIPETPAYIPPSFDGIRPTDPGDAPKELDVAMQSQFQSAGETMRTVAESQIDKFISEQFPGFKSGLAAIESRLQMYLGGGSALSGDVETAMFQRSIDKNEAEFRREYRSAMNAAARAGFTMPSVTLANQAQDIDRARRNNNAQTSREILIKQAELEQNNLQFAVTQSANLKQVAINAAVSYLQTMVTINGQALEYARAVVAMIVQAYDIALKRSEIQARLYEAEASVYQARLKGAMAALEAYQATIRALEAQTNVSTAQVNAYKARIEAVQAEASVFRAQADVVISRASIEKMLTEIYQAKVQAYGAQVNARTAEWQGFSAATQGETALVNASAEQVRGYQAKVQAYQAQVQAKLGEIDGAVRTNEARVRKFAAEVDAYRAQVQGEAESTKASIESYLATIKAYDSKAQATTERAKAAISFYEQKYRNIIANANLALERMRLWQQLDITRATGMADVSTTAAHIYASTAQAALSGMNSLAASTETVTG